MFLLSCSPRRVAPPTQAQREPRLNRFADRMGTGIRKSFASPMARKSFAVDKQERATASALRHQTSNLDHSVEDAMRARVRRVLEDIGGEPDRLAQFHFAAALRALCDDDCRDDLSAFADEFAREEGPVSRTGRHASRTLLLLSRMRICACACACLSRAPTLTLRSPCQHITGGAPAVRLPLHAVWRWQPPPEKARQRWQHAARRAAESKAKDIATAARLERARKQRLGRKSFFARESFGDDDDVGSTASLHHSHLSVDEVAGYFKRFEPWAEQRKLLREYGIDVGATRLQLDDPEHGATDRVVLAAVSAVAAALEPYRAPQA